MIKPYRSPRFGSNSGDELAKLPLILKSGEEVSIKMIMKIQVSSRMALVTRLENVATFPFEYERPQSPWVSSIMRPCLPYSGVAGVKHRLILRKLEPS